MNFQFPDLPRLSLWGIACRITGQNPADPAPTIATQNKLAELAQDLVGGMLRCEWALGTDIDFAAGVIPKAANAMADTDWRALDRVFVRRNEWQRYAESLNVLTTKPLLELIESHVNESLAELPYDIQKRITSYEIGWSWDEFTPIERLDRARKYDDHVLALRNETASIHDADRKIDYRFGELPLPGAAVSASSSLDNTPGKMPRVAIGKLAVKAAWQLETQSKRAAIAKDVLDVLKKWANAGMESDTLLKWDDKKRAVTWRTHDGTEKTYDLNACKKTLETWTKSRA